MHILLYLHIKLLFFNYYLGDIANPHSNGSVSFREPLLPEPSCLYISDKFQSTCNLIMQYVHTRQVTEEVIFLKNKFFIIVSQHGK